MSKYGISFQKSKAGEFVESLALERNIWTDRTPMTAGVSSGSEFQNVSERAVHSFAPFNDVHSTLLSDSVVVGTPGSTGSDLINGSGWVRVFLRVKGVAHMIPPIDYEVTEGSANTKRIGAVMFIQGTNVYSVTRTKHRVNGIHSGLLLETDMLTQGRVCLNLFQAETGFSDSTVVVDRIVAFSAQLPVNYAPQAPGFSWTSSVFPAGGSRYLYSGGTQGPGVTPYIGTGPLGTPLQFLDVCKNSLNSTNILTGLPLFANPTNIIQLQIQRLGFRPDTVARPESYQDLV